MAEKKETELTLNEKLALIQVEMKAKKSRFNSFGKYNFRSAEDLLEAVKPYLTKYNVSVTVTEELIESNQLFPILKSSAIISDGDIAAVMTYTRNAWGNKTGEIIQTQDIVSARAGK